MKEHIESFPRMEFNYTIKTTKKQHLQHDLNITKDSKLYLRNVKRKSKYLYVKLFIDGYSFKNGLLVKKGPVIHVCSV